MLTLVDDNDRPIAVLSSRQGSPEFAFFDQQQRKRSALFLETNGTPDLYLFDAAGKERAALNLYDSGTPNLALLDAAGGVNGPNIILESTGEGNVRFAFHDFQNKGPRIVAQFEFALVNGSPSLRLIDASGKRVWSAP
jgi:hypothetical protein